MTLQDLLTRHGLVAYLPAFEANHVPLSDLPHLSDEDLRADFGMSSFIDRKRFKAMVAELQAGGRSVSVQADPFETWTVAGQTFKMRIVEPCTFVMGSPEDEPDHCYHEMQHEVTLTRRYAIGVVPVTQALWTAVMGINPAGHTDGPEAPQRPVETVSWYDALRFCNAASAEVGLRPVYTIGGGDEAWGADEAKGPAVTMDALADGFRLPTEAEWECAARAGTRHVYAGGDDLDAVGWIYDGEYDEDGDPVVAGWFDDGEYEDVGDQVGTAHIHCPQPVGRKHANAWGIYDMSGNVWEWCEDRNGVYSVASVQDPIGPTSGRHRVRRGGSWYDAAGYARAAYRGRDYPGSRRGYLGLRLSRTIPRPSNP